MPYTKTTFVAGGAPGVSAAELNKIGDGIATATSLVETHAVDRTLHVPYAIATGSANIYAITLTPAPSSYLEGMAVAVKINVVNTGASTINVNGLGAKSILKANGSAVSSGNLKVNSVYTLRYNGTAFILQGEGGEYGTAGAGEVLAPYTVGQDTGLVTGTIVDRGTTANQSLTVQNQAFTVNAGYHRQAFSVTPTYLKLAAGDTQIWARGTGVSASGATYNKRMALQVSKGTTYRVKFGLTGGGTGTTAWAQIYINGVPRGIERVNVYDQGTGEVQYSEDITVNDNDTIELWAKSSGGSGTITNPRLEITTITFTVV